jgi:hypothetical protein
VGHGKPAEDLRTMIDVAKSRSTPPITGKRPTLIAQPRGDLAGLLDAFYPKVRLTEMVLDTSTGERLQRIIKECKTS